MTIPKKTVVVLGAGVTGLAAAYVLSKNNFDVLVIERNDFLGGLAATFPFKNYSLDYGPHNLHTHIPEIIPFIREELGIELRTMPITSSKIYFNGMLLNYPINILDTVKKTGFLTGARCFLDYIAARVLIKINPNRDEDTFEDWVKNRFGRHLYGLFFGPYVEKVWGIPALELDVIVAKKRIPEPSLFTLLLRSLTGFKFGKKHSEDPQAINSFYPINGIGSVSCELSKRIIAMGGRIELNATVKRVELIENEGSKMHYQQDGILKIVDGVYLVNTIPINSFFEVLNAPKSELVKESAALLFYRGTIFLYMFLSVENLTDFPWVYFNDSKDKSLIFNRMFEIKNFNARMIHNNKGVVCLEITCSKDDEIWKKTDNQLFELCIAYLERHNFMKREMVTEVFTKRIEEVYPVFRKNYSVHLMRALNYLAQFDNVISIGRQGLFSYANVDHCISMGLHLADLVEGDQIRMNKFLSIYDKFIFH